PSNTLSSLFDFNNNNHDQINSSLPNIYEQDITTNFSLPCFETYELDDANTLLPDFSYEHNIENVSSVISMYINIQDTLTESDGEAQPKDAEDNEHKDNKYEDNEHEDSEHEDSKNEEERKNYLLRWYNNSKINKDEASVPIYQIKKTESNELLQPLSFQHLARFKQTPNIVQSHGPKQKYGFGMGYAKKALDLAIHANKVDDFVNEIERFIEKTKKDMSDQNKSVNPTNVEVVSVGDLLRVQHKD
ncbi:18974_t:CDS:2, partial [Gigaspora margarita]